MNSKYLQEKNRTVIFLAQIFNPLGFSGKGKVEGELVFMGYGISAPEQNYDDYKDKNGNEIDIKGKILVIMRYSPGENDPHNNPFEKYEPSRYKTLSARDGEAAGIIFITGPQSGEDVLQKMKYDNVMQKSQSSGYQLQKRDHRKYFQK